MKTCLHIFFSKVFAVSFTAAPSLLLTLPTHFCHGTVGAEGEKMEAQRRQIVCAVGLDSSVGWPQY